MSIENSVTSIIAERTKLKSRVGARNDSYRVGLVVEGGGMRGVVSGGMITALQALGILEAIDEIHAVSSGGFAGAYGQARQTPEGTSIYYENINNKNFIDWSRPLRGEPVINIPYLIQVTKEDKPLDWKRVVDSNVPLHIYVTSAKDANLIDFSHFSSREELLDALHWSSRIPIFAGMPIEIQGSYFTDGSAITGGIALDEAVSSGCTHILVLLTRPDGTLKKRGFTEKVAAIMLKRNYPQLSKALREGVKRYEKKLEMIRQAESNPSTSKPKIEAIRLPTENRPISSTETNRKSLIQGALNGYESVVKKFEQHNLYLDATVQIRR